MLSKAPLPADRQHLWLLWAAWVPQVGDDEVLQGLSPDIPSLITFVPTATKLLVFTSPLLLGRVLLYDYRTADVVRSVAVPMVRNAIRLTRHAACGGGGGLGRHATHTMH